MPQRMGCPETRRCYTAAITFAPSSQRLRVGGVTMQQVTVRVPASTSNLGPGYDCLGVALRLYNSVTVVRGKAPRSSHPQIVSDAAERFFKQTRRRAFSFSCSIVEQIPRCRGLGSSATVRLGILLALNHLSGKPLDRLAVFRLCAEVEGHPDNAAPATFGGFTVTRSDGFPAVMLRRLSKPALGATVQRFDVASRLYFVLLVPDLEIQTVESAKDFAFKDFARCCSRKLCERVRGHRGLCIARLRKNAWHFFR